MTGGRKGKARGKACTGTRRGKCSAYAAAAIVSAIASALLLWGCGTQAEHVSEADADSIPLGGVTLETMEEGFRETVEPDNPSGFYDIYDEYEGYRYYVMSGTASNETGEVVRSDAFHVEGRTGGRIREGKLLFLNQGESRFEEKLEEGESRGFVLFLLVAEDEEPEEISIFYNNDFMEQKEGSGKSVWDNEIRVDAAS